MTLIPSKRYETVTLQGCQYSLDIHIKQYHGSLFSIRANEFLRDVIDSFINS